MLRGTASAETSNGRQSPRGFAQGAGTERFHPFTCFFRIRVESFRWSRGATALMGDATCVIHAPAGRRRRDRLRPLRGTCVICAAPAHAWVLRSGCEIGPDGGGIR
jgi:hypothetical protein